MSDKPLHVTTATGKTGTLDSELARLAGMADARQATPEEVAKAQRDADAQAQSEVLRKKFENGNAGDVVEGLVGPNLAGTARGLSAGLSDQVAISAADAIGGHEAKDAMRQRLNDYKDYAPIRSAGTEFGAIAGSALVGDESGLAGAPGLIGRIGAGLEGSVARGLGGGLAARGAAVLARGAAEGAVFGAGNKVSEAALEDKDLTGESLIAGAGWGAVGGAAAAGVLGAVGKGGKALVGSLRAPSTSAFESLAARTEGEAAPGIGRALQDAEGATPTAGRPFHEPAARPDFEQVPSRPTPGTADSAGDAYIRARGGDDQAQLGEIWKNREIALNGGADRIEGHERDLARAISDQQRASAVTDAATYGDAKVNHMDKLVDRSQFNEQADKIMNWMFKAQDEITLLASDTAVTKLGPAARREFDGHMVRLGKALESGDSLELFRAADETKRFLGRQAQFGRQARGLTESAKAFDSLYQKEGVGLMHALEDPSWGKAADAQRAVNGAAKGHIFAAGKFAPFTTEIASEGGRPVFGADTNKVHSFLGQLTKAANDNDAVAVREMISSRRAFLDATAKSYDHGSDAVRAIAAERDALNRMESTFEKATKETSLINQTKRLQSEEQAQKIGGLLGVLTDAYAKPVTTLQRIATLEQATKRVLGKSEAGVSRLVGGKAPEGLAAPAAKRGGGFFSTLLDAAGSASRESSSQRAGRSAASMFSGSRAATERKIDAVTTLSTNPALLTAQVGSAVAPHTDGAPGVAAAANNTAMAGVAFLASKVPPSHLDQYSLQPQLQRPHRSDTEISQFNRYVEAVDNPLMVLDEARKGTLTREHVDAVKAVYPKIYQQLQQQVMRGLVDSKLPLPYGRRIQLGVLLDIPTDKTLSPEFISAVQKTYAAAPEGDGSPPAVSSAHPLQIANSFSTATQLATEGMEK